MQPLETKRYFPKTVEYMDSDPISAPIRQGKTILSIKFHSKFHEIKKELNEIS